jgi:hypothetical protein
MAIFRLIPAGDLQLNEAGDFVWLETGSPTYTRQRLAARFQFVLGEYFLDQRQGISYYRDVFVKNPDLDVLRSLFRRVILTTPDIVGIASYALSYDEAARAMTFNFVAIHASGEKVVVTPSDEDFIVALETSA